MLLNPVFDSHFFVLQRELDWVSSFLLIKTASITIGTQIEYSKAPGDVVGQQIYLKVREVCN